jgi:predicted Zn-dependent protease
MLLSGCANRFQTAATVEPLLSETLKEQELLASYEQTRSETQLAAAREQTALGNLVAAEENLAALLLREPDHTAAGLLKAEIMISNERHTEALALLDQLIGKHPHEAAAHHLRGMLLHNVGQTSEALDALTRAVELEPANEMYRLSFEVLAG